MDIRYCANDEIEAKEIIDVFNSAGWHKSGEVILDAFKNSYYVTARERGKLVGFARAISDNYYYTGIYDVVVRPDYERNGIGKAMVSMLTDKFKGTYFFLTYTEGKRAFYEKCGFRDNVNSMWIPK
jgi:GNAT superfamily N-acetyltransferase